MQWWYGHNAVAFFLTTPILGIMYYFLPKAAERPVYSYRLSIIHFWSLVFIYIWAGPAPPAQHGAARLGADRSAWSSRSCSGRRRWGGMLNGLLTLRGAWDKLRTDPVLKFFVVGVTFYGMATFEGPLLSIKRVNALAHYTDWIIGHVHARRARLERLHGRRHVLLARAAPLRHEAALDAARPTLHFWLGDGRHPALRRRDVGRAASRRA